MPKTPDQLTRQAIRLVQRENRKRGIVLTKEDVLRLKVQTVAPWTRAFFVLIGICVVGIAVIIFAAAAPWWISLAFAVSGLAIILLGIFGRKRYLEAELRHLPAGIADGVISGIFNALI
jgi:hypothetical protein